MVKKRSGVFWNFLGFFALGFGSQIVFLILFIVGMIVLDVRNPGRFSGAILDAYLWPLLILPRTGGSHGGEMFFMPFTALFYSLLFSIFMIYFKRIGTMRD